MHHHHHHHQLSYDPYYLSPVVSNKRYSRVRWNQQHSTTRSAFATTNTTTRTTTTAINPIMMMMIHNNNQRHFTTTTAADPTTTIPPQQRCSFDADPTPPVAKVVVVGSNGRMGQIRTQIINSNSKFELIGIVDHDFDEATNIANTYRVPSYPNLSTILKEQSNNIDGIVCCSPTFTHKEIIETCVEHNKNDNNDDSMIKGIFVEKPVAATAIEIESLFDLVDGSTPTISGESGDGEGGGPNQLQLCCGFQRRFDLSYAQAKDYVHDGKIGSVITANIFFGDHPCPSQEFLLQEGGGGNIFQDLCAHDVDYILQVLKYSDSQRQQGYKQEKTEETVIESVYAIGSSSTSDLANCGVQDNGTMVLKTKSGIVITLFMSRSATYGYDQRCEIFGTLGKVQIGNIHENSTILCTNEGLLHSKLQHSFPQRFEHAFQFEMDTFADVLLSHQSSLLFADDNNNKSSQRRSVWPITKSDCIQVQQIADAALESSNTGQIVSLL